MLSADAGAPQPGRHSCPFPAFFGIALELVMLALDASVLASFFALF
jgi:hypothetical protein